MASKKNWLKWLITLAVGLVLSGAVAVWQGFSTDAPAALMARSLSDGLFVAGLMFSGLGALVWVSSTGFFDMFSYGFHSLLVLFSVLRRPEDHVSYYDYKLAKDQKRGKPMHHLLAVGVWLIALSAACLYLYYQLPA